MLELAQSRRPTLRNSQPSRSFVFRPNTIARPLNAPTVAFPSRSCPCSQSGPTPLASCARAIHFASASPLPSMLQMISTTLFRYREHILADMVGQPRTPHEKPPDLRETARTRAATCAKIRLGTPTFALDHTAAPRHPRRSQSPSPRRVADARSTPRFAGTGPSYQRR